MTPHRWDTYNLEPKVPDLMILIKMGGSVITDKSVPLSYQEEAVSKMADSISKMISSGEHVIVVHGGGSFGHYYSTIYDMHTKPDKYDLRGVAIVRNSMISLNSMILETMLHNGIVPYSVPPSVFVHGADSPYPRPSDKHSPVPGSGMVQERTQEILRMTQSGLCPVTYGDVIWHGQGRSYILSGDLIMVHLARILRPKLAIFATDVDGLYAKPGSGDIIKRVDRARAHKISSGADISIDKTGAGVVDVTGGMRRKVQSALDILKMGVDTFLVNGNKPDRIRATLKGKYHGTLFSDKAKKPDGADQAKGGKR